MAKKKVIKKAAKSKRQELKERTADRVKKNNTNYALKIRVALDAELQSMHEEKVKAEDLIKNLEVQVKSIEAQSQSIKDMKLRIEGAIISIEKIKHDACQTES